MSLFCVLVEKYLILSFRRAYNHRNVVNWMNIRLEMHFSCQGNVSEEIFIKAGGLCVVLLNFSRTERV